MTAELVKKCLLYSETCFGEFGYLNSCCIGKRSTILFLSSSRDKLTLLWQNLVIDVSVGFHVGAHPDGHQHGVSIQSSVNFGNTLLRIAHVS